jgi:hypothetical protein
VELEKVFVIYLKGEIANSEKASKSSDEDMSRVVNMLNTWEKYKILTEFVRRAFSSIDRNLSNLSRDGDAKSVSALAVRMYILISFFLSLTHSFTQSLIHSITQSLIHSITDSSTHSPTHSLTHTGT